MRRFIVVAFAAISLISGCTAIPGQAARVNETNPTATLRPTAEPGAVLPTDAPSASVPDATTPAATASLSVDGAQQFQKIDGFGVNANAAAWRSGQLIPALDLLTSTMRANIWRVIVESHENWETTNDNDDPAAFNWDYYNQLYETPKFQALWGLLQYLDQKNVDVIYLNVMGCIPEWMGGCAINEDAEHEWVEMIASLLYYARNTKHLRIDIVSPMNEIDLGNPEGPKVDATQYIRVMNKLSARLDALGLGDIQLIGPDTASVGQAADSYIPAMVADPAVMAKMPHFAAHSYDGNTGALEDTIGASAYPDRNFWITEFSAWCTGCDTGTQPSDDWGFATETLDKLFQLLDQGASSALVYDAYDSLYEHHGAMGYWGLTRFDTQTESYVPRKRFYTLAQLFRFVPAGMRRIAVTDVDPNLNAIAFADPATGDVTIVGRNYTSNALTLAGTLENLDAVDKLEFYQTTRTADLGRGPDVSVTAHSFSVPIAPESIFTLTTKSPTSASHPSFIAYIKR